MKRSPAIAHREALKMVCSDLGHDLDSPECRPVREHLRTCPKCSAWKDSLEKTVDLFRRYPVPRRRKAGRGKAGPGKAPSTRPTR
jgi:predicted anti-sigma-YlaC factor YlaD